MALANGQGNNGIEVKKADQIDLGDSATKGDIWPNAGLGAALGGLGGAASFFLAPYLWGGGMSNQLLPELPPYWSRARDAVLSQTIDWEDFWAAALTIAVTKAGAMTFEIEAINSLMAKRGQELFNDANGNQGWGHYISQHALQFLTTDIGTFTELDRVDNSKPGSKVIGIYHLDSMRCYLTGDPDRPVIYQDLHGTYHYLAWWQVFHLSDMPNPLNNYFGVGRCAAGRAYRTIRRRVAAELYDYQKMTGGRPQELNFLGGITPQQLENILKTNESDRQARGMTVYNGAAIVAMMTKDAITNVTIPIASKPSGFDEETELEHAAIKYAAAIGLDKADLKPFTGKMAGTATQSLVQDSKATGKGLALWRNRFEYFMSNYVLPNQASFHFVEIDLGQLKQKAEVFATWATALTGAVGKEGALLDPTKALNKLVDENQLDQKYLTLGQDLTPAVDLTDDEKPLFEDQQTQVSDEVQAAMNQQVQQVARQAAGQPPAQAQAA
jgi:hypothetical protein